MTDIFISYSRKDQPVARWLSELLQREGWDVWWDPKIIPGEQFSNKIQEVLTAAKCVIVIWSKESIKSDWVQAEASEGLQRRRLVPVSIADVKPPLPFGGTHTIDLMGWQGDLSHPGYQELVRAVRALTGLPPKIEKPTPPRLDSQRFSVVVAQIQGDTGQQMQDVIVTDLTEFKGIQVITVNKTITVEGPNPEDSERFAEKRAHAFLDEMGATVIIWGKIIRFGGKAVPRLQITVSRSKDQRGDRYLPTGDLRMPRIFWSDLADVLRLVILTYDADNREQEGTYLGDQLRPFIPKVRQLLQRANEQRGWSDDAKGLTRIYLGDALMLLGSQGGQNQPLEEAVEIYRTALTELSRNQTPRDWARAQNGLGISLWMLGSRHGDTELLEEAIDAYNSALEERSRDREPLEWGQTHNDLGNVLAAIGQRESGTKRLEEAVQAYRIALEERTIEAKPIDWAQTQNNLGVALWQLGQRESGLKRLEEAEVALRTSFEVYNRETTPLDWSQTQNNLGLVLWTLGQRSGDIDHLRAAVKAYREALRERKRDQVPLLWSQTQNNLGLAFWSLGELTNSMKSLEQAVGAFRRALGERTRDRAAMDWAQTQNNLGAVYWSLGQRRNSIEDLKNAVQAYWDALTVYSREDGTALDWAQTMHNLGNALTTLGEMTNDEAALQEALDSLRASLGEYDRKKEPLPWAQTQGDLGYTAFVFGKKLIDPALVHEAEKAFRSAHRVYKKAGMLDLAKAAAKHSRVAKAFVQRIKNQK